MERGHTSMHVKKINPNSIIYTYIWNDLMRVNWMLCIEKHVPNQFLHSLSTTLLSKLLFSFMRFQSIKIYACEFRHSYPQNCELVSHIAQYINHVICITLHYPRPKHLEGSFCLFLHITCLFFLRTTYV